IFIYLYRDPHADLLSLRKGSNKYLSGRTNKGYSLAFLIRSICGWFIESIGALWAAKNINGEALLIDYDEFCKKPACLISQLNSRGIQFESPTSIVPGHWISCKRMRSSISSIQSSY